MSDFWSDADIISVYTRQQAIDDGVLVDVTETARQAGFRLPVALTREAYVGYVDPSEYDRAHWAQDEAGRLWDVLNVLRLAIEMRSAHLSSRESQTQILFAPYMRMQGKLRRITFKAICGPGDAGEPVLTVMMPDED